MQFEPPAHCLNAYNAEETSASTAVVCNLSDIKDHTTGGSGLDIYGINTGIYTTHTCFSRCTSWGAVSNSYTLFWILHSFVLFNATLNQTFGGYANKDGNGHGTHTAGTAVGKMYSIATSAQIIAVKVLSDQGSGSYSDIISGVNWAYNQYKSTCCPFIAMMSLGRPMSMALDNTPKNATMVHYTSLLPQGTVHKMPLLPVLHMLYLPTLSALVIAQTRLPHSAIMDQSLTSLLLVLISLVLGSGVQLQC